MLKDKKPGTKRRELKYVHRIAWLFGIPYLVATIIFGWYPIGTALVVAFQKFSVIRPCTFVGLDNFKYFIDDPTIYQSFRNTFYYAALSIGITFMIPIFIAILLMEMKKNIIRVMMILWFIPVASMAGIIIWKWFYNTQYGLFNGVLVSLNLPELGWLEDSKLAMICLVLPGLIMYGPGLIYIATIQGIPEELYEAAHLEGAGFFQKIWHITLPRIRPIIAMMLLLSIIGNLQVFNQPYVMTGGGPNFATYSVVMYLFDIAFQEMRFGRATALSLLLFVVIMVFVILQRKYFKENPDI